MQRTLLVALLMMSCAGALSGPGEDHCNSSQWRCDNGDCIAGDNHCNGRVDCADGSDETAQRCIHLLCPSYAFRCAYGACIAGSLKCNGRTNCADNSDETQFLCSADLSAIDRQIVGNCSSAELMQCKSGECLDNKLLCDGRADCSDGSDEAVQICSALFCPAYAFRCGYGACIRGNAQCDGTKDCLDGSDEVDVLCTKPPEAPLASNDTNDTSTTFPPLATGCAIPASSHNLIVEEFVTRQIFPLGSKVGSGTVVSFRCANKWQLRGASQSICVANRWLRKVPTCTQSCKGTLLSLGISTIASCHYRGELVDCFKPLPIGSKVHMSCAMGYQRPPPKPATSVLSCNQDAEWDGPKMQCTQQCVGGEETSRLWEASIFQRSLQPRFVRVCSGSIISAKLVISVARCFLEPESQMPIEPVFYNVLEGLRNFVYRQSEVSALKGAHNVSQIVLPPNAKPEDIAVLVLVNYIRFTMLVKPICLNFEPEAQQGANSMQPTGTEPRDLGAGLAMRQADQIVLAAVANSATNVTSILTVRLTIQKLMDRYAHLL